MLKWLAVWVLLPILIVGAVIVTASFVWVPVPAAEYQSCLQAALLANEKNPDCPHQETLLTRGMGDPVAYYTLWLTLFTGALAVVGIGQGLLSSQQIRLSRDEFAASHRPKLRVKHVWPIGPLEPDKPCSVNIVFTNVGDGPAVVGSFGIDFNVIDPNQRMPGDMTPSIGRGTLRQKCGLGETQRTGTLSSLAPFDPQRIERIQDGTQLLVCFGFIEYTDDGPGRTRKTRRTAFCREYVPVAPTHGNGRYGILKYPDPDYEYED